MPVPSHTGETYTPACLTLRSGLDPLNPAHSPDFYEPGQPCPTVCPFGPRPLLVLPGRVGQGGNVSVKPHTIARHFLAFSQTLGGKLSRAFLWGLQHRSYPFLFVPGAPWALCLRNPHPQRLKPDFLGKSSEAQVRVSQSLGPPHSLMFWTPRGPTLPPAMPS